MFTKSLRRRRNLLSPGAVIGIKRFINVAFFASWTPEKPLCERTEKCLSHIISNQAPTATRMVPIAAIRP
jgi:hypothetical protein